MKTTAPARKLIWCGWLALITIQTIFGQPPAGVSTVQDKGAEAAQCQLTLAQLPNFRGLYLGMSEAEVRKLFAQHSKYQNPGVWNSTEQHLHFCPRGCASASGLAEDPDNYAEAPAQFQGVSAVHFGLSHGKVETLIIYFEDEAMPADAVEFAAVISRTLSLPPAWRANRYFAVMQCQGFRVRIEGQDENKLALIAIGAEELAKAKR